MIKSTIKVLVLLFILLASTMQPSIPIVRAQENKWTTLASMPTPKTGLGAAVVNGKIYAISNVNEEYNPDTNTWTSKTPIPTRRTSIIALTVNNKIYAFGGYLKDRVPGVPAKTIEEYNPRTDTWTTKGSTPTTRGQMSATVVDNIIYVMGGLEFLDPENNPWNIRECNKTEAYDPITNTWTTKAQMPIASVDQSSASIGDKIYVFSSPIQIYDTKTDSWSIGPTPPIKQTNSAAVALTDKNREEMIFILGGGSQFDFLNLNQIFYPKTRTWSNGTSMPTSRRDLAAVVLDNFVYALGGATLEDDPLTREYTSSLDTNERYTPTGYQEPESTNITPTPTSSIEPSLSPTSPDSPQTALPSTLEIVATVILTVVAFGLAVNLAKKRKSPR